MHVSLVTQLRTILRLNARCRFYSNFPELESGRTYRFRVRAVNYCSTVDVNSVCYGDFSESSAYTVRYVEGNVQMTVVTFPQQSNCVLYTVSQSALVVQKCAIVS